MNKIVLFTLLFCSLQASAEIFKWKDANGNIVYGDSPEGSNKAKSVSKSLPKLTVFDSPYKAEEKEMDFQVAPVLEAPAEEKKEAPRKEYTKLEITSPKNDTAVRSNEGIVDVSFHLEPGLQEGDELFIYIDGKKQTGSDSNSTTLKNVTPGSHSIFAVIKNAEGDAVFNSPHSKFHLLRTNISQKEN